MAKVILDPPIPFIGPVRERFLPGKVIKINGTTPSVAHIFNVYLQCGSSVAPRDDVAIQISVRLLDGYITLNALQNGRPFNEKRSGVMPIRRGERFELCIICDFNQYKLEINGQFCCQYPQEIHYDRISNLAIDGDISVFKVSFESYVASAIRNLGPSAPICNANMDDDFEMINPTSRRTPAIGIIPPTSNCADPPSYDSIIRGGSNPPPNSAPYPPSNAPYPPSNAPYPLASSNPPYPVSSNNPPYPTSGNNAPYPTSGNNAPYPTPNPPYPTSNLPYPVANTPFPIPDPPYPSGSNAAMPLPSVSASGTPLIRGPDNLHPTVPLNLNHDFNNFRNWQKRRNKQKCAVACIGLIIALVMVIVVIIIKVNTKTTSKYSTSTYNYDDNYNNNGGYNTNNKHW